jgi:hypothetical protein
MKRFSSIGLTSIFIVFITLIFQTGVAQDSLTLRKVTYKANITFVDKRFVKDYLLDISDTSLLTVHLPAKFRRQGMQMQSTAVPYMQIDNVIIQRKGSAGRGALIGLVTGTVLGGIVGAVTYKDCGDCFLDFGIGFDIGVGAFLGSVGGTLTGLLVGSLLKKRFIINGQKEKFEQMKLSVLDMAYRKQKKE